MTVALPVADIDTTGVPGDDQADPILVEQIQAWSRPHPGNRP
jgi:hypothetical protein